ncbi:TPR repeat-containing protein [Oleiphilus messinensis]|uniref:TPR repeat-containing protein n=1 Tax=Oleiphilus messinensis TaxID=141451 RepID=A0A1Y0I7N2_9GAMM|nr:tetratricopeptide repeat protein [Oleiphilus messinensis]ARU56461.1 TPR repeat-containing protein [Oleiphilus messinensis]
MKLLKSIALTLTIALSAPVAMAAPSSSWGSNESSLMTSAETKIDAKNYAAAIVDLKEIVADDPNDADAYNLLGYTHRKLKQYEQAEIYYQRALSLDPEHKGALEYLGELYLETDRIGKAHEMLARLDKACFFGCEEYDLLKDMINQKVSGVAVTGKADSSWR